MTTCQNIATMYQYLERLIMKQLYNEMTGYCVTEACSLPLNLSAQVYSCILHHFDPTKAIKDAAMLW